MEVVPQGTSSSTVEEEEVVVVASSKLLDPDYPESSSTLVSKGCVCGRVLGAAAVARCSWCGVVCVRWRRSRRFRV